MTRTELKSITSPADPLIASLQSRTVGGSDFVRKNADAMDTELRALSANFLASTPQIALIALGGYGRAELCPHSDIDLMFLVGEGAGKKEDDAIEKFLYALWDEGFKVGHSTRSLSDCVALAEKDSKILTSLLDARFVDGNVEIAAKLEEQTAKIVSTDHKHKFVQHKLQERNERHGRYGDTRYVLEPNIKEGKGGLRDFQTLIWIAEAVYGVRSLPDLVAKNVLTASEARRFSKAHDFLLTVRCHLHQIAGRAEERLHFDIQPDLAERLGYTNRRTGKAVERFMKHYFLVTRDVGDLTRILCEAIESDDDHKRKPESYFGFEIDKDRLLFGAKQDLKAHPLDMLRLFRVSQETGRDIHPHALKEITRHIKYIDEDVRHDPLANQIFLEILTAQKDAALTLKRMNEAGLLGRFIPDFGRIIALMQFDRYHHFTVDEHTLRCIDILHKLEEGKLQDDAPIVTSFINSITERTSLYVAMFLHDICKGRGGRHAELGAELAHVLGPRLGLSGQETDLVSWLVHEHLLMSDTAFRRNMNDPKTIADFSAKIRSPERLDLLLALTTADIMGVGPDRWTAWKARLLEELYLKTRALMDGEEPGITADIHVPEDYKSGETRIDITTDEAQSATIVIVYTPDRPGLFATLCGALSAEGASIMRAYIATLQGKLAVDRFVIQNHSGLPFRQDHRQQDLRDSILNALNDAADIAARIETHKKHLTRQDMVFDLPPKISIHNNASGSDTVVEVEARDRHGLLYDIACTFRDLGLDLRAAKINTQGLRAIDAFYLQTAKRKKLTDAAGQERLVDALAAKVAKG